MLHFPSALLVFLCQVLVALKAFASWLEEQRFYTTSPVPYSPGYKDQNRQTDGNLPKSCRGEGKYKERKCAMLGGEYERSTEVEDELEGEKIGLLLTVHKAPGLGQVCEEVLLSFQWFLQPCGGRRERVGDIVCCPSIAATWAQTVESQDVSCRGTIDPTGRVGGKPGRSNHIRPLKGAICQEFSWIIHHSIVRKHADAKRRNILISQYKNTLIWTTWYKLLICKNDHVAAFWCFFTAFLRLFRAFPP